MVSYRCIGYGITGNDGVATLDTNLDGTSIGEHSYTGSGVGELDFVASVDSPTQINSGSDVSQPYTVDDAIYYDTTSSDTTSRYYLNTNNASINYSNGKILITYLNTNQPYVDLRSLLDSVKGKTVKFKCDVVPTDCEVRLEFVRVGVDYYSDWTSTSATLEIPSITIADNVTSAIFRILCRNGTTGASYTFTNFEVCIVG